MESVWLFSLKNSANEDPSLLINISSTKKQSAPLQVSVTQSEQPSSTPGSQNTVCQAV